MSNSTPIKIQLKQLRNKAKYTIKELAELSGVSAGYICELENGKYSPSLKTIEKLRKVLPRLKV